LFLSDFYFIFLLSYQEQNENFNEKDKVRVVVRIRPINDYERGNGDNEIISCDRASLIVEGKTQSRKFLFDSVFDPNSTQDEMFNYCGIKRLVNMAIDGYICTCFAYGQTGSGKTYTMVGPSGTVSGLLASSCARINNSVLTRKINLDFILNCDFFLLSTISKPKPYSLYTHLVYR
jgi:hypothetical protein